jgi:hypothetical protein
MSSLKVSDKFAFVSPSNLRITIADLLSEHPRRWSSLIPNEAPIQEASSQLKIFIAKVEPVKHVKLKYSSISQPQSLGPQSILLEVRRKHPVSLCLCVRRC